MEEGDEIIVAPCIGSTRKVAVDSDFLESPLHEKPKTYEEGRLCDICKKTIKYLQ